MTEERTPVDEVAVRDDWDQHWTGMADCAARNPAQAMRRRLVRSLLNVGDRRVRILDIGCGQGDLVAELRQHQPLAELCGIDHSKYGLDVASAKVPDARFAQRDLTVPGDPGPELAGWATHAACMEVLEHVDDPSVLLTNARSYLAPGCRLIVTVPGGPMSAFDRHIGHRRHYTPDSLRALLATVGFEVERATGAGFPFFNLFRGVVILRGERLASDAAGDGAGGGAGSPSLLTRIAMGAFRPLLAMPVPCNRWGWQMVAVARVPGGEAGGGDTT
jgi:2-polyprenyl-3-methyl-5-hydroxy-6-metoxy-1,4-benzoquinol methylase